jgi:FkbM family methyltransferase
MNDRDSFDWCKSQAPRGTWLDIGAHHGIYTKEMSALTDRVYAFEASPASAEQLAQHTQELDNVTVVHAAVTNQVGNLELYLHDAGESSEGNTINLDKVGSGRFGHNTERHITVPATTIDHWADANGIANITFIKIDVEGAEQWVLEGARNTLLNNNVLISMEQHQMIDCDAISQFLESVGYKVTENGHDSCPLTIRVPGCAYIIRRK